MTLRSCSLLRIIFFLFCCVLCAGSSWSPLSTRPPPNPSVRHPLPLTDHWDKAIKTPYPTNEWWQNIVLEPSNQPISINPLSMRVETMDSAELSNLPPYNRSEEYADCWTDRLGTHCPRWSLSATLNSVPRLHSNTLRRGCNFGLPPKVYDSVLVATNFAPGFVMSAKETLKPHQVMKWDKVSVTIQFTEQTQKQDGGGSLILPLVRGMPYATGVYSKLTPYLFTLNAILSINDQDLPGTVTGNQLRLKMNNEQVVLIYAWSRADDGDIDHDEPLIDNDDMQWKWDRNTVELVGPGESKKNWLIRMAMLKADSADRLIPLFDRYAATYPTAGEFDYSFEGEENVPANEGESITTSIVFETSSAGSGLMYSAAAVDDDDVISQPDLLMMSLPHHQATFVNPQYENDVRVDTLVGDMVAVVGRKWLMKTPAVPKGYMSFRAPRPVDPNRLEAIKVQLIEDINSAAQASEPDPYGFGKSLAKIGRLLLMADELGIKQELIQDLLKKMKTFLSPWLESKNKDTLLYDTVYGGIVSQNGINDPADDFGQGYYNDHHFHYGYIVYGCSVVAHFDPAWGSTYRENILALLRDYANPSKEDPFFPVLRQFDAFDGHSWAAGLFVFADGRNQESSSESINGYYAMMLLGSALGDAHISDLGRMLTSLEIYGTLTYWQSRKGHSVYPQVFADNKCIGMKWSQKVVEATWFAAGMVYVHGINMLPFTPLSELYLTAPWVTEEYPVVIASVTSDITDEWKGFLYGTHCVIDEPAAWKEIQGLSSFDGGNTRSNLMYFCATRPKGAKRNRIIREHTNKWMRE